MLRGGNGVRMFGVTALALAVVFSAYGVALARVTDPIKIGVVTSRSGPLEYYGTMETRGLELGIEYATKGTFEVLGRKIQIIIEDDAGDPGMGVQKARKLIESDKVDILQGSPSSGVALAVQKVAEQYKKVFIVDPAAADSITAENYNRYTFRTASNVSQDAIAGGKYAVRRLGKKAFHIAADYAWGRQSAEAWGRAIESEGGVNIGYEYAPLTTTDFTPYLQKAIAAKPDVLVISWSGSGAVKLYEQIRELGLFNRFKVTGAFGDRKSVTAMGEAAYGLIGVFKYFYELPDNPVNDWLVKQHQARYKENPDIFTGPGFSAGIAIVEALKKAGSTDTEALIKALEGLMFETPKGKMTIRKEDHQALQAMYVVQLVKDPNSKVPTARLIEAMTAEETAPPVAVKK